MAHHVVTKPATKLTKKVEETCFPGELTCFERPRFFCGQLLTDVELTAQQTYGIDKHRLHNRMLHGAGVVCGLRVQCDPQCDGWVTISPGYAIDCYGNDIIVCEPTRFDVLDAIRKYEAKKRGEGCIPPPERPGRKEYCLALVYEEAEVKPVTALIRCNGNTSTRCEPSRIAEKFRVEVLEREATKRELPPLLAKIQECVQPILANLGVFATRNSYGDLRTANATVGPAVSSIRDAVINGYNKSRIRCALPREIREIRWPSIDDAAAYKVGAPQVAARTMSLIYQYLIDCFCEALLIECPECADPRVTIACVNVEDGEILHICNTSRRHVITFPALGYWLSPLTYLISRNVSRGRADSIAELIELLCCGQDLLQRDRGFAYHGSDTPEEVLRHVGEQASYHASLIRLAVQSLQTLLTASDLGTMLSRALEPGALTVADVHGETPERATALLQAKGYRVVGRREMVSEEMPTIILGRLFGGVPPGAELDLLLSPDGRVMGFVPRRVTAPPKAAPAVHEVEDLMAKIADLEARLAAMEERLPGPGG